jgi:thiamine-monophosphate kinase
LLLEISALLEQRYFTSPGLRQRKRILPKQIEENLLLSWRRVQPALEQGRLLVENRLACCGIDTSDGLKIACEQIAEASKVNVIVDADKVPISPLAKEVAELSSRDPMEVAFGDSVDFRLVFSAPESKSQRIKDIFREKSLALFEIGRLDKVSAKPAAYLRVNEGLHPLPGTGWTQ